MPRRAVIGLTAALALAVAVALAGCAGSPSDEVSAVTPPTSAVPTTAAGGPLGFSDTDDGRTVNVAVGQRLTVILHSSEFVFSEPSDPAVLRADGPPTVTTSPATCVEGPGSGCGTVVASFVGVAPGAADLVAERPECAAPACDPADARWHLMLLVGDQTAATTTTSAFTTTAPTTPAPTTPGPTTTVVVGPGQVTGTVRYSPVCPVESDPPDPACAPRPGPATVELAGADGIVVATGRAGEDGAFVIPVAPGEYQVLATAGRATLGGDCQVDPAAVTVGAGTSTAVTVACDTGIR